LSQSKKSHAVDEISTGVQRRACTCAALTSVDGAGKVHGSISFFRFRILETRRAEYRVREEEHEEGSRCHGA
jgi:hypothetical protein